MRDQRIDRERACTCDRQRHVRAKEYHHELETAGKEEPRRCVHEEERSEHVEREPERDRTCEQSEDQRDAAEELEKRDRWADDTRQGNAHLTERTGDAG